jgi:hypothetical protein
VALEAERQLRGAPGDEWEWHVEPDTPWDASLLPGESRTIDVFGDAPLLVEGWSVEAQRVG